MSLGGSLAWKMIYSKKAGGAHTFISAAVLIGACRSDTTCRLK